VVAIFFLFLLAAFYIHIFFQRKNGEPKFDHTETFRQTPLKKNCDWFKVYLFFFPAARRVSGFKKRAIAAAAGALRVDPISAPVLQLFFLS